MKIILYAEPGKTADKLKKLMKRWDVEFTFVETKHKEPTLQINGTLHEWPEFDRQEKLFTLIDQAKKTRKLKIKSRPPRNGYSITLEGLARINTTLLQLFNYEPIGPIIARWSENEKEAGLIMWYYAEWQCINRLKSIRDMVNESVNDEIYRLRDERKRNRVIVEEEMEDWEC